MKALLPSTALIAALINPATAATLAGDTIDAYVGGVYGQPRLTGFGLDAPFVVKDGRSDTKQYSNAFTLDVDGNGFQINFLLYSVLKDGFTINLTDLDFSAPSPVILSDLTVSTNVTGLNYEFTEDSVKILLGNVFIDNGMYFKASFSTSPVPEPSNSILMTLGLAWLAYAKTHRSRPTDE